MKTILLPTDFSPGALWAARYAGALARQLGTRLVLMHAYDPIRARAPAHEWLADEAQQAYFEAVRQLGHLREQLLATADGTVSISMDVRPGDLATVIREVIIQWDPDLLVMGLAGDEPLQARLQGSLATELIPTTTVPMLLVPPGAVYQTIRNLVLAVDLTEPVSALALDRVMRFARLLGATLDVVCMSDEPELSERAAARGLRDLLRDLPHTFSFVPGNDLSVALNDYFDEHRAELVITLPKPHNWLQTLLLESVTQHLSRQSALPVLAVC